MGLGPGYFRRVVPLRPLTAGLAPDFAAGFVAAFAAGYVARFAAGLAAGFAEALADRPLLVDHAVAQPGMGGKDRTKRVARGSWPLRQRDLSLPVAEALKRSRDADDDAHATAAWAVPGPRPPPSRR